MYFGLDMVFAFHIEHHAARFTENIEYKFQILYTGYNLQSRHSFRGSEFAGCRTFVGVGNRHRNWRVSDVSGKQADEVPASSAFSCPNSPNHSKVYGLG